MTFFVREIKLLVEECYAFHFLCLLFLHRTFRVS